jgi:hypothetical protein
MLLCTSVFQAIRYGTAQAVKNTHVIFRAIPQIHWSNIE